MNDEDLEKHYYEDYMWAMKMGRMGCPIWRGSWGASLRPAFWAFYQDIYRDHPHMSLPAYLDMRVAEAKLQQRENRVKLK